MQGPLGRPAGGSKLPGVPAVSVCIPTYNYARYLPRAIESVLAQTYGDFELIVSDNASTDDTQEVLAGFSDPRMRTFRNERNLGLFGNFSRCLELARGDMVKFVCADDWLDPAYLSRTVPLMETHDEIGLLTTDGFFVDEQGRTFALSTPEFDGGPVVRAADALRVQAGLAERDRDAEQRAPAARPPSRRPAASTRASRPPATCTCG